MWIPFDKAFAVQESKQEVNKVISLVKKKEGRVPGISIPLNSSSEKHINPSPAEPGYVLPLQTV